MYTVDNVCKMIELLIENICAVWRTSFLSGNWNSNRNKLCSITFQPFSLLIWAIGDLPGHLIYAIDILMI